MNLQTTSEKTEEEQIRLLSTQDCNYLSDFPKPGKLKHDIQYLIIISLTRCSYFFRIDMFYYLGEAIAINVKLLTHCACFVCRKCAVSITKYVLLRF